MKVFFLPLLFLIFSIVRSSSLMAIPHPMLEEESPSLSSSTSAHESTSEVTARNRREADLTCQAADPSINNIPVDNTISSTVSRGTMPIGKADEPRTSEESITTGTSGEPSIKQVPTENIFLADSSSFAPLDARETPPLQGRLSDVTQSSPGSTSSQADNPLALITAAHASSFAIKEAVVERLRQHPDQNDVTVLRPAYAQLRTLAQEQLAFVKSLPADHPDREEMVFKASEIVSNFLDVALQSSRPSTEEEKKAYLYDDFLPASTDQDHAAIYNKQDIRVLQYEFQLAKELLEEKGDQGESLGKKLATARLDRSWRAERYVSGKHNYTSYQEPYWSNAVTANKTAIKNRKQRFIETGAPIENPIEARRAALNDILELLEEGFKVGDRQMQF